MNLLKSIDNNIIYPIYNLISLYLSKRVMNYYKTVYADENQKSQNLDYKSGNLGYAYIHYAIIRNTQPNRILCIGSMRGYIPFICAIACKDNKNGIVDFVDAGYDIKDKKHTGKHFFGDGFWNKINIKKHFSYLKANQYINTYITTSKKFAQKCSQRKYDYIHIDGDHTYKGLKLDYKLYWNKLNKGGFMVFHDMSQKGYRQGLKWEMWKFWNDLKTKNKSWIEFPDQSLSNIGGIGIIQKQSD